MSKDILKWVLIAGAAYLVYRYLTQMSASSTQQATAALPDTTTTAGTTVSTTTTTTPTTPVTTVATPETTTATPTVAQSLITVMQNLGYDPQGTYNGYEWNYFWERTSIYNGIVIGPTEMGIGDTDRVPLSAAVAAIHKILSGVQGLSNLPLPSHQMISAWSM